MVRFELLNSIGTRAPRGLWLLSLLWTACAQPGQASSTGGDRSSPPPPPFDLSVEAPWPPAYSRSSEWTRAATGDDLAHARLAQGQSAASLLEALTHGGSLGRTALSALAYVPDRRRARDQLCALAARAEPATLRLLVDALLELLIHAPLTEEAVDPRADAECERILKDLAQRPALAVTDRDRLIAAIQRLALR